LATVKTLPPPPNLQKISDPGGTVHPTWSDWFNRLKLAVETATTGGQAAVQFEDEGANLGTPATVNEVDFVGTGVTATRAGNKVTVTIAAGSGNDANLMAFAAAHG
jgi:hypothetical protein